MSHAIARERVSERERGREREIQESEMQHKVEEEATRCVIEHPPVIAMACEAFEAGDVFFPGMYNK